MRLLPLLALLLACSPTRLGADLLDRAAYDWGYRARVVATPELSYHYLDSGERGGPRADRGVPLVLLHGFGGDGVGTWRAQLEPLADERRVLVPDLLWFGRSTGGGSPGLDAQVAAVLAMLDHAGVAKVDVMGISYGGFVTLGLLGAAPERVNRVILVDSPGPFFSSADQAAMLARFGVSTVEELFLPDTPEDVGVLLDLTWHAPLRVPRPILAGLLRESFSAHREQQRALLADLQRRRDSPGMPSFDGRPRPLVVWGEHDEVFPLADGEELADAIGAEWVVIPDTAHGPSAEKPAAFNAAVIDYLSR